MARWEDWQRTRHDPDTPPDRYSQALGRKVLGELMEGIKRGGLFQNKIRREFADGTVVIAQFDGTTPIVQVLAPATPEEPAPTFTQLWLPRGFVVYPAWQDRRFGVGLPVVQDPNFGVYAAQNLAPGLNVTRWTSAGPCGEVLISPDKEAGYPLPMTTPAPLLYDEVYGPRPYGIAADELTNDTLPKDAQWAFYRCEFVGFKAWDGKNNVGVATALFEYINTARKNAAVAQAWLPFRGYTDLAYDSSLVLAQYNLPQATNPVYPPAYATSPIRLTKDGYPTDIVSGAVYAPAAYDRTFFNKGLELGALNMSVPDMFSAWQNASGNQLTANVGASSQLYAAQVQGFAIASYTLRDRWINAGNVYWKGSDPALPPVSWHGFASVNLAWETYPVTFNATGYATTPVSIATNFTGSNGDCWLRYPRNTSSDSAYSEPALSRHIYCRGRAIAMAPRGGLVWGACVLKNGAHADRLIALVHHPEDQPTDTLHEGFTRYFRVWWCDIPRRTNGLPLTPEMPVCGEDLTDPWSWRGGDQFDVGSMPAPADSAFAASSTDKNSLKYASCWRFKADGTGAACMRDYAAYVDYAVMAGEAWAAGANTRVVELKFEIEKLAQGQVGPAPLHTDLTFHDFLTGQTLPSIATASQIPLDSVGVMASQLWESGVVPLAVDYDPYGNLVYAFWGMLYSEQLQTYHTTNENFAGSIGYSYIGIGAADARYIEDLQYRVLQGARFKTPYINRGYDPVLVLDVKSATFAMQVHYPRFAINVDGNADPTLPAAPNLGLVPNYPCQMYTVGNVNGVLLSRLGCIESEVCFYNPDGALWSSMALCHPETAQGNFTYLPLAISNFTQGFYVERFGELIYGYQVAPMPNAAWYVPSLSDPTDCGCLASLTDVNGAPALAWSQQQPRGGKVISTVPLPSNDWCIYAKAV